MDVRQQIESFTNRYKTVAWLLLFMGGGLLLQLLLWIVLPAEAFSQVLSFLVLPPKLKMLLFQPWSLVTWPFFMLSFDFLGLLFSGLVLWGFGQIHQQLLGEQRTRRIVMLAVPVIGLLTVTVATFLPASPYEVKAPTEQVAEAQPGSDEAATTETDSLEESETVTYAETDEDAAGPGTIVRGDLRNTPNPQARRLLNHWFPSGLWPIIMVLVVASATLVPSFPVQLFLFGRVKIVWIAVVLVILEILWAGIITPLAFAIIFGALLGFLFINLMRNGTDITEVVWRYYASSGSGSGGSRPKMKVKYGDSTPKPRSSGRAIPERDGSIPEEVIDRILDKISEKGYESLSREEKELLFKASSQKEDGKS